MQIYIEDSPMAEPYILAEDVEFPDWIDRDSFVEMNHDRDEEIVWVSSIKDLNYGGCASGCYMPAVTYYKARQTMAEHGDEVLAHIWEQLGEIPAPSDDTHPSFSAACCHWLSMAVEMWAQTVLLDIEDAERAGEEVVR